VRPTTPSNVLQTAKKIGAIKSADGQQLKGRLRTKAAKTVNNILTVLNVVLKNQPLAVQSFWRHFGDGEGLRRKDQ
jgi:hypothetical protein